MPTEGVPKRKEYLNSHILSRVSWVCLHNAIESTMGIDCVQTPSACSFITKISGLQNSHNRSETRHLNPNPPARPSKQQDRIVLESSGRVRARRKMRISQVRRTIRCHFGYPLRIVKGYWCVSNEPQYFRPLRLTKVAGKRGRQSDLLRHTRRIQTAPVHPWPSRRDIGSLHPAPSSGG